MRIDRSRDALLVVDLQHDFLPGGTLAVREGDAVIAPIAELAPAFDTVVATQDLHPPHHVSFASSHPGKKPFESVVLPSGARQELCRTTASRGRMAPTSISGEVDAELSARGSSGSEGRSFAPGRAGLASSRALALVRQEGS